MDENIASYEDLGWIVGESEEGFYALIAPPRMQKEVVSHYDAPNSVVFDYGKEPRPFFSRQLTDFVRSAVPPETNTVFVLNMQIALPDEDSIRRLNFSRDILAGLKKNLIFCLTEETFQRLNRSAHDFFSFIKLRLRFEDETPEDMPERWERDSAMLDRSVGVSIEVDPAWTKWQRLTFAIRMENRAKGFMESFRYTDALTLLETVFRIRSQDKGETHIDTAEACFWIAQVYREMRKLPEALKWYQKALEIQERVLGPEHWKTLLVQASIRRITEKLHQNPAAAPKE